MKTKLEMLRVLELMCKSLVSCIDLHRSGVESYDDVLTRIIMLNRFIEEEFTKGIKNDK